MKDKLFGVYLGQAERIKPELMGVNDMTVAAWNKIKHQSVSIEVRSDKTYGARAELYFNTPFVELMTRGLTKKDRGRLSKAFKGRDDRPIDTSKWVKPDETSIKQRLVSDLMIAEVLLPDYGCNHVASAKVLFGALYSKSPRNPQPIMNISIDPYFETIFKVCEKKRLYKKRLSFLKPVLNKKKPKPADYEEGGKHYEKWKAGCLKHMVVIKTPLQKK